MKKLLALMFAFTLVLSLSACGILSRAVEDNDAAETTSPAGDTSDTSDTAATTQATASKIITEEVAIDADTTEAQEYHFASEHEEFSFAADGTLTEYLRIFTFLDDADKDEGLANAKVSFSSEGTVELRGNTVVVNISTFDGMPLNERTIDEVRNHLKQEGQQFSEQ